MIEDLKSTHPDLFERMVSGTPALRLISGPAGEIYWANAAFLDFIKYTQRELSDRGWYKISVDDENLQYDRQAMADMLEGSTTHYHCQKAYVPKGEKPVFADITVERFPPTGSIVCLFVTVVPLRNGTAVAFNLAIETKRELKMALDLLTDEMKKATQQDQIENWVVQTLRVIKNHPRKAAAIVAIVLSVFGANNVLELLQRLANIGLPVPAEVKQTDSLQYPPAIPMAWRPMEQVSWAEQYPPATPMDRRPMEQVSWADPSQPDISITTAHGNVVHWRRPQ